MRLISKDLANGDRLSGVWCNLGSPHTAEIAAKTGFDWVLIDAEHGPGDHDATLRQVNAIRHYDCAPIVRIAANEPYLFKRALDTGAAGVMVPQIRSVEETNRAAAAANYPPRGIRGVSKVNAATCFGLDFDDYRDRVEEQLALIIQIETAEALDAVEAIAAVDGVDALFIGPMDLSYGLGVPGEYDNPMFIDAMERVVEACRAVGKAAGTLLGAEEEVEKRGAEGFTLLALGADGGMVAQGMRATLEAFS